MAVNIKPNNKEGKYICEVCQEISLGKAVQIEDEMRLIFICPDCCTKITKANTELLLLPLVR